MVVWNQSIKDFLRRKIGVFFKLGNEITYKDIKMFIPALMKHLCIYVVKKKIFYIYQLSLMCKLKQMLSIWLIKII